MKSILEELFYGNVYPNTDCRSQDKETKQLMEYVADHHDSLIYVMCTCSSQMYVSIIAQNSPICNLSANHSYSPFANA